MCQVKKVQAMFIVTKIAYMYLVFCRWMSGLNNVAKLSTKLFVIMKKVTHLNPPQWNGYAKSLSGLWMGLHPIAKVWIIEDQRVWQFAAMQCNTHSHIHTMHSIPYVLEVMIIYMIFFILMNLLQIISQCISDIEQDHKDRSEKWQEIFMMLEGRDDWRVQIVCCSE